MEKIIIDIQKAYAWRNEYTPLYEDLKRKKRNNDITREEKDILYWLTMSFTNYLFKGMS